MKSSTYWELWSCVRATAPSIFTPSLAGFYLPACTALLRTIAPSIPLPPCLNYDSQHVPLPLRLHLSILSHNYNYQHALLPQSITSQHASLLPLSLSYKLQHALFPQACTCHHTFDLLLCDYQNALLSLQIVSPSIHRSQSEPYLPACTAIPGLQPLPTPLPNLGYTSQPALLSTPSPPIHIPACNTHTYDRPAAMPPS